MAISLESWADGIVDSGPGRYTDYRSALRECAAKLRQGDWLPGGLLYDTTARERPVVDEVPIDEILGLPNT